MGMRRRGLTGKILIAGVGDHNLRDLSFGPVLMDRLAQDAWPHGVEVEDFSYSPVRAMHSLDEHGPYERMIFVAGVCRHRQPGSVYCYPWAHQLPTPEEVQACVSDVDRFRGCLCTRCRQNLDISRDVRAKTAVECGGAIERLVQGLPLARLSVHNITTGWM